VNVSLAAEEIAELDKVTAPVALYPNWFQTFAVDAAARDALASPHKD
jgi:hypothetical protein